ncbi:LysR substrate-binding domain-containing protein [Fodinicurvata sediminis]|uniref:LysR substrate-binding domain-containing protein n=1 Tax=Fodinicurvata sediminis TaxID=1121832 RepID=UPI0003B2FBA2|nr:LysR substrate-binding domain-containing protein [Fodinicurvata sediminis]
MPERRTPLPPLDYLIAFEAAALQGSFTAAGEQLNLSQAAVSRKIRLLEEHLGVSLFVRGHRSVQLTPNGKAYLKSVRKALDEIRLASADLRKGQLRPHISIAATQSVSTLWLVPRLSHIRQDNPDIDIDLVSTDEDEECLQGNFDLVILRGEGRWSGYDAELLLDEEIFPVCTKAYGDDIGLETAEDLAQATLIEVASHHSEWMNWRTWLREQQIDPTADTRRFTFNTYALSIQAACDGLGVALGWRHLVDDHLNSGALVRPIPQSVHTGSGYYLLKPRGRALSEAAQTLRDWLFQSVGR